MGSWGLGGTRAIPCCLVPSVDNDSDCKRTTHGTPNDPACCLSGQRREEGNDDSTEQDGGLSEIVEAHERKADAKSGNEKEQKAETEAAANASPPVGRNAECNRVALRQRLSHAE